MKKRVLSGIQPSGRLHLGNYFGMIKRMVDDQENADLFCFVANLHSLTTTIESHNDLWLQSLDTAKDLIALGIKPEKCHFWLQSYIPEVTELAWILSCVTPHSLMEKAHSYKDKVAKGIKPTLGLFNYPMLMAADILINQTDIVPVGKDQKQHVEIARDIAVKFNNRYGETFTLPEAHIQKNLDIIPGTDGQKMSKSYNNTIPIFGTDSEIKKAVMGIVTDSKAVEDAKDPENCNVFALYKLFANSEEQKHMAKRYKKGGLGYGEAKKALLEKIQTYFKAARELRTKMDRDAEVIKILDEGAVKVRKISLDTLAKVRAKVGLMN